MLKEYSSDLPEDELDEHVPIDYKGSYTSSNTLNFCLKERYYSYHCSQMSNDSFGFVEVYEVFRHT